MPTQIKLWRVDDSEHALPVAQGKLDLESRLEEWLKHDIGLISDELLVIGQQVETAYGGIIDLLAMDPFGNLVILELKRHKTPRDIVAQALDYASWVQDLGHESITEIANGLLNGKTLEQAFMDKFQADLPEVLNESHRMYIVASSIDAATERIIRYLSETHDVDINVATFAYFTTEHGELLGRSLLLDDADVQTRAASRSKRKPARSWVELHDLAERNGVVELYDKALEELRPLFDGASRGRTNVTLWSYMGPTKSRNAVISVWPEASIAGQGLAVGLFLNRIYECFGVSEEQISPILGIPASEASTFDPNSTWFFNSEALGTLIELLERSRAEMSVAAHIAHVPPPATP